MDDDKSRLYTKHILYSYVEASELNLLDNESKPFRFGMYWRVEASFPWTIYLKDIVSKRSSSYVVVALSHVPMRSRVHLLQRTSGMMMHGLKFWFYHKVSMFEEKGMSGRMLRRFPLALKMGKNAFDLPRRHSCFKKYWESLQTCSFSSKGEETLSKSM
jgi:hypothetical protein